MARLLLIPAAALLAAGILVTALITVGGVPVPEVRIVVGEQEPEGAGEAPAEEPGPAPESTPEPPEEPSREPTTEPRNPGEGERTGSASEPLSSFSGSSTSVGPFRVVVETAYADATVTDGRGSDAEAPSGMTYYVYRVDVTNEGSSPAIFDSAGTEAFAPDGTSYTNDVEAEVTVAWDYFWDEIDPGTTVTTHLMFLVPEGTEFTHLQVSGQSELRPS
ncbi:DUF4352 domain-containing protein [Nocardiopsis sp. MG754419]|uniref:DUF4352 domain-containing protein n=1 Tax=Nocardiopsis sp. MG754419 TaxID=2259865 RepID=UPI001BAADB83|nr:DUF4352 domain-containing protein [Nocardiopsis sp. MG754419]